MKSNSITPETAVLPLRTRAALFWKEMALRMVTIAVLSLSLYPTLKYLGWTWISAAMATIGALVFFAVAACLCDAAHRYLVQEEQND